MKKENYLPRILDTKIKEWLQFMPAILIEGPKWCGKTSTSAQHCASSINIGSPENNFTNRMLAQLSPSLVLQGEPPRMIDEWQEVPSLWDAVRIESDNRSLPGQFILTGSSTPVYKGKLHSGAGRIGRLRLRTMSLYESQDSSGKVSLQDLLTGKFQPVMTGEVDLRHLIDLTVRGGWPGVLGFTSDQASAVIQEYIKAIVDEDIPKLQEGRINPTKMKRLLVSLARNESTTASMKALRKDMTEQDETPLDDQTISSYLDVLSRIFLLDDLPPFPVKIRSSLRLKKQSKRHFADPSIAAALLNVKTNQLINDLNTYGFLFEAMAERDLRIYAESLNASVYHYQDYKSQEIDTVVQLENGDWWGFEIKLGAREIENAASSMLHIKKQIEADKEGIPPKGLAVLCGMTNAAYQREDGVYVLPLTALKP